MGGCVADFYQRGLTAVKTIENEPGKVDLTANKLHGDVSCCSSCYDLFSSIRIGGILLFSGLVLRCREHQECVDVGMLGGASEGIPGLDTANTHVEQTEIGGILCLDG